MSRYHVDKLFREIIMSEDRRERFLADRAGYLEGRELTADERAALQALDFAALYRLGAHPYLCWFWALAVHRREARDFLAEYAAGVEPHGRPDFST